MNAKDMIVEEGTEEEDSSPGLPDKKNKLKKVSFKNHEIPVATDPAPITSEDSESPTTKLDSNRLGLEKLNE